MSTPTSNPNLATELKNVSAKDRKQIEAAQEMLGPDPSSIGIIKNTFWGNFREDLAFPYPTSAPDEVAKCDQLLAALDVYLKNEHPAIEIDQKQEIPTWVIQRLFELGVLGMTIPATFGGLGLGITSYNRVLERVGRTCGSTAVLVSAHQSIGCKALMLFGNDEQKKRFLPLMARSTLSAFCLSEPNVGCDAGGQETHCELSADGTHYILNGEKKWATSGALAGLFTVMAKQKVTDPKTGKTKEAVSALICTPDMPGVDIFSRNRSKCGIRGTWQARIRLTNVKVPRENLLSKEGKGLNVALTCLNYGRCTLSAGMLGAARYSLEQACKWAKSRHQFDRSIAEFDLMQEKIARMAAYVYAMDAMLYMTTGFLDRHDEDIMIETAMCKVFCSEYGYRTVDDAVQIMGGESYMTENHIERMWRDSRINIIVEGANEVMHSFIFAYGSKQLGEYLLKVKANPLQHMATALQVGAELYLGVRRAAPKCTAIHPRLRHLADDLMVRIQEHSHHVKVMFKTHEDKLISNQMIQERLSQSALWIHAMTCTLARCDANLRAGLEGSALERELAIVEHLCAIARSSQTTALRALFVNNDESMKKAAAAALAASDLYPNSAYSISECSPDPKFFGTGRSAQAQQDSIPQFGTGSIYAGDMSELKSH